MGVFFIVLGFIMTTHCLNKNFLMPWPMAILALGAVCIAGGIEMCIHRMV